MQLHVVRTENVGWSRIPQMVSIISWSALSEPNIGNRMEYALFQLKKYRDSDWKWLMDKQGEHEHSIEIGLS